MRTRLLITRVRCGQFYFLVNVSCLFLPRRSRRGRPLLDLGSAGGRNRLETSAWIVTSEGWKECWMAGEGWERKNYGYGVYLS